MTQITELQMLRAMVDANGLQAVDRKDYHMAKAIREHLERNKPEARAFVPSGNQPESNQAYVDRLPTPEGSEIPEAVIAERRAELGGTVLGK